MEEAGLAEKGSEVEELEEVHVQEVLEEALEEVLEEALEEDREEVLEEDREEEGPEGQGHEKEGHACVREKKASYYEEGGDRILLWVAAAHDVSAEGAAL